MQKKLHGNNEQDWNYIPGIFSQPWRLVHYENKYLQTAKIEITKKYLSNQVSAAINQ